MSKTRISWSQVVWNALTGCDPISPGCANCYAKSFALRLKGMGQPKYVNGFDLTLHEHLLDAPRNLKKPSRIFVNSMSDLFHADVPEEFIQKVFTVMNETPQHQYQVLTKRAERMLELSPKLVWSDNIWMGVTVENSDYLYRVDHLKATTAKMKFLSIEPLLSRLENLNLEGIDWVLVGGESGNKARQMAREWATEIRDNCLAASVPFFFKQWSSKNVEEPDAQLEGRVWKEFPENTIGYEK